jgi:alkylation response protein AidB-like acyl-CoA dehydrogenase
VLVYQTTVWQIGEAMEGLQQVQEFMARAQAWLAEAVPVRWVENRGALSEDEKVQIRSHWDRQLYEGGYAGLSISREYGGQGLGLREEVLFHEAAARAHAPEGIGRVGKILTAPTLIEHGTDSQRSTYLPQILRGEQVWCQGFSEPGAGSDLANISATARKVEGGYVVSGQKTWTSFAQYAQKAILLARTDPSAPRHRNLSYFLLDMDQPGVTFRTIRQISDTSHFSELFLDDAFVADEDLVGAEGAGWAVAMTTLTAERGGVEAITRYVDVRGDLDLLLRCCVSGAAERGRAEDLDIKLELLRWQVTKGLDHASDDAALFRRTSVLKVLWSEVWQSVTETGVATSCRAHQDHWRNQYLETRAMSIYSGTNEIQRNIIGERVLGLPR